MSTRSRIAVVVKDENNEIKYRSVYSHWDGYPEHHLPILMEHYGTQEKVETLINMGGISSLSESIECPEGHTFDKPIEGYTVFYTRDRGEELKIQEHKNIFSLLADIGWEEYVYVFENNEWRFIDYYKVLKMVKE